MSPNMMALKAAAEAQGITNNPRAVYNLAAQMGVSGNDVDRTFGLDLGTSNAWTKSQGLSDLVFCTPAYLA